MFPIVVHHFRFDSLFPLVVSWPDCDSPLATYPSLPSFSDLAGLEFDDVETCQLFFDQRIAVHDLFSGVAIFNFGDDDATRTGMLPAGKEKLAF